MSFYLRLSVATPHSVATACGVSLFASALPESSLCLLVCLRVLLPGVLLGFSGSGCSSGWIVAVGFPGLGFCLWAERPFACCPGLLAGFSCFLPGGRFPICWLCLGLWVPSPSFHSPRPKSLSLLALLAPASRPWGFPGWGLCLSWLLSLLGLSLAISWWPTYWYPFVSFQLSSGRSFPPSWWGPALLLRWTPFQSVLLVCPGRWLLSLALSSAFCQVLDRCLLSSLWLGWCSASFPAALHPISLSLACWLFPRFFCHGS